MQTECVKEAPTIAEAVDAALEELGVQQDAVEYEVLQEPSHKLFGLATGRDAKVRVWLRADYELPSQGAPTSEDQEDDGGAIPTAEPQFGPPEELSDEELDRVADAAVEALQAILGYFGIQGTSIEEYEGDEGEIILDVVGGDLALLIGRHGRTLDALQALVGAITNRTMGFRYPVIVDVEGYRHRRRQKIEEIARRAADRAARQHAPIRLRPMTGYERRVVHVTLRDDSRVKTASEGEDPFRMVVVSPR